MSESKKESMSVHKGLAELKIIDSRIEKKIQAFKFVGLMKKDGLVDDIYEKEKFNENAIASYNSIRDLTHRKIAIKSAIVASNAITIVKIGNTNMTVSDAIAFKEQIKQQEMLLVKMIGDYNNTILRMERDHVKIEAEALKLATEVLGKEDVKVGDADVTNVIDPYIEKKKLCIVDPLGAEKEIEKLQESCNEFILNIDAALSESNAITQIEV